MGPYCMWIPSPPFFSFWPNVVYSPSSQRTFFVTYVDFERDKATVAPSWPISHVMAQQNLLLSPFLPPNIISLQTQSFPLSCTLKQ